MARPEESSKVMHNAIYKGNGSREFPLCQLRISSDRPLTVALASSSTRNWLGRDHEVT